jgi:hypothetical protein
MGNVGATSGWRRGGRLMVIVALAWAPAARAQTGTPFAIQGSVIRVIPSGSAFSDTKGGTGFDLQLRRGLGLWSIGAGVQYSSHEVTGATNKLGLTGIFVEPRRVFPAAQVAPYISMRGAVFRQSLTTNGTSASATGFQANAGGGILIGVAPNVNIDAGGTFGVMKFGTYTVTLPGGESVSQPGGTGSNLVLRVGLAVGFGKAG